MVTPYAVEVGVADLLDHMVTPCAVEVGVVDCVPNEKSHELKLQSHWQLLNVTFILTILCE